MNNKSLLVSMLLLSCVTARPQTGNIFEKLAGTWDYEQHLGTNKFNPHTISITDDMGTLIFQFRDTVVMHNGEKVTEYRYQITGVKKRKLTLSLQNETRTTEAGEPVWWELILEDDSTYYWRRNDWAAIDMRRPVVKLKQ